VEVTLATSAEHESLVDKVYDIFHGDSQSSNGSGKHGVSKLKSRVRPWLPHLSLAYDNPDDTSTFSPAMALKLASKFPSLLGKEERQVTAIALWKTEGKMEEWKLLDRIEFVQT